MDIFYAQIMFYNELFFHLIYIIDHNMNVTCMSHWDTMVICHLFITSWKVISFGVVVSVYLHVCLINSVSIF